MNYEIIPKKCATCKYGVMAGNIDRDTHKWHCLLNQEYLLKEDWVHDKYCVNMSKWEAANIFKIIVMKDFINENEMTL